MWGETMSGPDIMSTEYEKNPNPFLHEMLEEHPIYFHEGLDKYDLFFQY